MIEKILNNVMLDERIEDGIFDVYKEYHMDALREYLVRKGMNESTVLEFCNKVVEGKYPERQAYNAKGILVTFPTPEYKAKAIEKGSHYEKDPTKKPPNIFGAPQQPATPAPQGGAPAPTPQPEAKPEPKTNLPISQAAATPPVQDPDPTSQPTQAATTNPPPETTAAPQQSGGEEPEAEPTTLPPPAPKSPAETQANKDVIKKMLRGDDYMLEEVSEWLDYNAPEHIREHIKGI